jgi:MFS transporter, FHS family, L-fucose permease
MATAVGLVLAGASLVPGMSLADDPAQTGTPLSSQESGPDLCNTDEVVRGEGGAVPTEPRSLRSAFVAVTTLFFAWGFITSMIDPLLPTVKAIFRLTYAETSLTQFFYFIAYGVVSVPGAALVARLGYGRSIVYALLTMIVGCLLMPLATSLQRYELVLVALFVIASGITVLQVAANPLVAVLGPPERSHYRLTFSQAFNSLGTVIGPYLGSALMLKGGLFSGTAGSSDTAASLREASLRSVDKSFLLIAALMILLFIFIWRSQRLLAVTAPPAASKDDSVLTALASRWALLGAGAIFVYVGAEVSIGSNMQFLLQRADMLGVSPEVGAKLTSAYWFCAMVGRFAGSWLLTRVRVSRLLTVFAAVNCVLCLIVTQGAGPAVSVAAIAVGLFNSIMFPTIFTITLERSTASNAATSGLLCVAIIGGAILPFVTGKIIDNSGLHAAFFLPAVAYLLISAFAAAAGRARVRVSAASQAPG